MKYFEKCEQKRCCIRHYFGKFDCFTLLLKLTDKNDSEFRKLVNWTKISSVYDSNQKNCRTSLNDFLGKITTFSVFLSLSKSVHERKLFEMVVIANEFIVIMRVCTSPARKTCQEISLEFKSSFKIVHSVICQSNLECCRF